MNERPTVLGFHCVLPDGSTVVCVKADYDVGELWFMPLDEYERKFLAPAEVAP